MPEITRTKRVVLEHLTGIMAGMFQILGTTDVFPNQGTPLPEIEQYRRPDGAKRECSLIRVARGGVYYREIAPPDKLGRFNEAQR